MSQDAVVRTAQAGGILGIRGLLVHALSIEVNTVSKGGIEMVEDLEKLGDLESKKTVVVSKNEKATVHRCDQESPA